MIFLHRLSKISWAKATIYTYCTSIHSLSYSFFEVINFNYKKKIMYFLFFFMSKQTPHFNEVHKQADPELCRLFRMNDSHFEVQMCSGGSLQFLEAGEHGLAYSLFVGGVGPDDVLFLFPRLRRIKKKKKTNNLKLSPQWLVPVTTMSHKWKLTCTGSAPRPGLSLTLCISLERKNETRWDRKSVV